MLEPKATRPYWPDALEKPQDATSGLKQWSWATERLAKSHNYWIATSRPGGRPHLMVVWGIWLDESLWLSTGSRTRKAKNLEENPNCVMATEDADEAVIVEGTAARASDETPIKRVIAAYNTKYGGDLEPLLESTGSLIFRITPRVIFAQDEHAENFVEAATRWRLP